MTFPIASRSILTAAASKNNTSLLTTHILIVRICIALIGCWDNYLNMFFLLPIWQFLERHWVKYEQKILPSKFLASMYIFVFNNNLIHWCQKKKTLQKIRNRNFLETCTSTQYVLITYIVSKNPWNQQNSRGQLMDMISKTTMLMHIVSK